MDALDVRIFCELAFKEIGDRPAGDEKSSPAAISRKLSVDEKTVRLRIKKMEESGFIKYYQAIPALTLFGLQHLDVYRFEAMNVPTKYGAVQYLDGLPGVVEAVDYLGPTISLTLATGAPGRAEQLADELAGRFELKKNHLGSRSLGVSRMRPDRLDWQVIERLRYDARAAYGDVAQALSVSPRMAQYRIGKILESGAVVVRAVINPQKQEGLLFYELGVTYEPTRKVAVVRAVRESHGEKLWSVRESTEGVIFLNLFGFTLAEPDSAAMELLKVPGVKWCSILILKEFLEAARPNWIDALIQEKIAEAAGHRAPPRKGKSPLNRLDHRA